MVFRTFALFPHMTVQDTIGFSLMIGNVPEAQRGPMVTEAPRLVQLEGYVRHLPRCRAMTFR